MIKKYILLSFLFLFAPIFAMKRKTNETADMQLWVQQASYIRIETVVIPIKHDTTVLDIKNIVQKNTQTPVQQQILQPTWSESINCKKFGDPLHDDEIIKEVMNQYDTNRFALTYIIYDENTSDDEENATQNSRCTIYYRN